MNKFFNDIVTDVTGNDVDVAKVLWGIGVISFIIYGGVHIFINHMWSAMDYGTGLGAALGGGGFAVAQRSKEQEK